MNKNGSIWITWEQHRRSSELAAAFDAELCVLLYSGNAFLRYVFLSLRTFFLLLQKKSAIVYSQNPSIVLAALLCSLKFLFGYKLVIDRHSNFKLYTLDEKSLKWRVFHMLSRFTTKRADLTIVTNEFLAELVEEWGGKSFILQDRLPALDKGSVELLSAERNIVFVSTFSSDEPIFEIVDAAKAVNSNWVFHITGNYKKYKELPELERIAPDNINLTGFLEESEYQGLLKSSDLIVVLTTLEHILTCGAYEAISIEKPLVVSDTKALRDYFNHGVLYTKPDSQSIAAAVEQGMDELPRLQREIVELKHNLQANWQLRFNDIKQLIDTL